ncbi:hypothetical protein N7463_001299 [Penicillium fimorum]|uniref:Uncharacterized protein n=1 Tax=Penicillium fimorum TaxID=1882269 RepID=A0A9W9Y649_9EURO|nr:hypothetical protein N7463_001299 [Penicillium fimorum]
MKFSVAILTISATLAIAAPTLNSRVTSGEHGKMAAVKSGELAQLESANEKRGLLLDPDLDLATGDLLNSKRAELANPESANEKRGVLLGSDLGQTIGGLLNPKRDELASLESAN